MGSESPASVTASSNSPPSSLGGSASSPPVQYAKPSEWSAHKEAIRKLYLDQNMTLDEVKRIMWEKHQFCATTSMYKKRIRAWGFGKKLKESEVLEILQQKVESDAAGKASTLVVRGRVVKAERLWRYLERKPSTLARLECAGGLTPNVTSGTSPQTLPWALPSPPALRKLEKTMTVMRDYIRECVAGPDPIWQWTPNGYTSRNQSLSDLQGARANMLNALDDFYHLQNSIDTGRPPAEVFQLLNSTLNHLSGAIKAELPDFFFKMIEILRHSWSSHPLLFRIFRKHIEELSQAHLGRNHPVAILWSHMLNEQAGDALRLAREVMEMILQELTACVGPHDNLTGLSLDFLIRMLVNVGGAPMAKRRYADWLATYPGWDNPAIWAPSFRSRLAVYKCGWHTLTGHPDEVQRVIRTTSNYQKPSGEAPIDLDREFFLTYLGGRIGSRLGDAGRAEGWFLKALEIARECDAHPDYAIKALINLQTLYEATDRLDQYDIATEQLQAIQYAGDNDPRASGCRVYGHNMELYYHYQPLTRPSPPVA